MSVNKVMLIGRLGQDPELKYTASGTPVSNFSMATNESWSDKSGQRQERTEWHRIVVWGKLAEICHQYLNKGRQAFIEGSLQTRSWEDQNGNKRYSTEVVAKNVQFLGSSGERPSVTASGGNRMDQAGESAGGVTPSASPGTTPNGNQQNYDVSTETNFTSDDIPF